MYDDFSSITNKESKSIDLSKTKPIFQELQGPEPGHDKLRTVWKPISQIDKNDLLPFEKKQEEMGSEIVKLEENNEEYFKGKQMRFDN